VVVPRIQFLSTELVMSKVYDIPAVRAYLPDFDKDAAKRMSRQFLFAIVHKLDPDFFRRAIREIESHIVEKKPAE